MSHHPSEYHPHVISVQTNLIVFAALMLLLVLTIGVSYLDLGSLGLVIALLIATVKAVLIMLYFMHVRYGSKLQWLFSGAAFFWLALMILITLADYLSRGLTEVEGK
jgi:cytochrome c oxidase subunit 4